MIVVISQAAEKQQENGTEHSASTTTTSLTSTSTVTTTSSSTIMVSAEPACGARCKKTCSQSGKAVSCTMAVPTVSQSQCCSHSQPVKPSVKLSVERDDPAVDKTIATQTSTTSLLTTRTSPQISVKLAKGRRGQKIGQPQLTNPAKHTSTKQPVDTVSQNNGMSVKCAQSFISDTLSTKSSAVSHGNTVSPLPNGLVSHTGKTAGKIEPQNNTASPPHGHLTKTASQLPNGLQVHAGRNPSKTSLLAPTGSNAQCGSKLGAEMTNGHLDKTSRKTVAEETDSTTQSSVMDTGGQVNGHSDTTTASTAAKSKKARRKGRGKEAQTSFG